MRDLNRPNGLAFSPDFKVLYVNNSDAAKNLVMRYDVAADGTVGNGKVFADLTSKVEGLADGLKVDAKGNVYTTGPAASGFSRRRASTSAPSSRRKYPPTAGGATTARRCT